MCVTMIVSITMKCSAGEPCVLVFIHCVCLTGPNLKSPPPETLMAIPLFSEEISPLTTRHVHVQEQ